MDRDEALKLVESVRSAQFEDTFVEVKAAQRQLPKRIYETLSAFANQLDGGVLILGLDEAQGFLPVGVADVQETLDQLSGVASEMEPPMRLDTVVVEVEGKNLILAEVRECPFPQKPCFYRPAGMQTGSYLRVGNTNRQMTNYEVFTFVSSRSQPRYDREPVREATLEDLNQEQARLFLDKLRRTRPQTWERLRLEGLDFPEQLCAVDVAVRTNGAIHPTLAGLLCFGNWPQKFYPSLAVTFVWYPGVTAEEKGPRGERFLDTVKCEGHLSEMVEQAVRRIIANMRQSLLVEGIFHRMLAEYPEEAVREAIVNAVAHRDYSPMGRSSQVRVQMFADRLEVQSPGGLYGAVNENNLEETQSTRNELVMRFLEDQAIVENRGSGIRAMIAAMREARLEPPRFHDARDFFRVTFRNATLMNPEAVRWLNQFAGLPLNNNQRIALVYLRHNERMTNSDYRRLNNLYDTTQATRELRELFERDLIQMHASRRWAYYTLSIRLKGGIAPEPLRPEEERVVEYVREHGAITRLECRQLLDLSPRQASYLLKRMLEEGLLRQVGERRWTRYVLSEVL